VRARQRGLLVASSSHDVRVDAYPSLTPVLVLPALTQIFSLSHSLAPLPPPPGPDLALLLPDGSTALALEGAEADVRQLLVLLDEAHRSYGALVERVGKVDPMQAERARRLARFAKPLGGGLIACVPAGYIVLRERPIY